MDSKNNHILQVVHLLDVQLNELRHEMAEELDPVLARAEEMDIKELEWWVDNLPECAYRVEMWRTLQYREMCEPDG